MLFAVSLLQLCAGISVSADLQCTTIPGKLRQIDAGAGEVYGVNDNDDIFRWVDNGWQNVPGKLVHVSVGPAGVWGVNRANVIYKLQDNEWMSVSGLLKQVDAGGNKYLSGVNAQDGIFCLRQSCTVSRSSAVTWTQLEGDLKYYSCGLFGCWGINKPNNIYFRNNVNPTACQGTQWQQVGGNLVMAEVGTDGSVYGVNSAGNVYRRYFPFFFHICIQDCYFGKVLMVGCSKKESPGFLDAEESIYG
ncbi:fish-egg lectin-like [Rana temporaria]|uniref:fish-egg lectin-like n=1 Tax=Rana temporaria TaxID=8407 RepID=UPI001AACF337|nr:fish-egg lectin-like [Rana temporaria]